MTVHPLVTALRHERERQRLTQQQIAARTGWTPRTIHAAETGATNPTLQFVDDYATALGIALTLIGRHGTRNGRMIVEVPPRLARRGVCPGCGCEFQMRRDGQLRNHKCARGV